MLLLLLLKLFLLSLLLLKLLLFLLSLLKLLLLKLLLLMLLLKLMLLQKLKLLLLLNLKLMLLLLHWNHPLKHMIGRKHHLRLLMHCSRSCCLEWDIARRDPARKHGIMLCCLLLLDWDKAGRDAIMRDANHWLMML